MPARRPHPRTHAVTGWWLAIVIVAAAALGLAATASAGTRSATLEGGQPSVSVLVASDVGNAVMAERQASTDRAVALLAVLVGTGLLTHALVVAGLATNGSRPFRAGRGRRPLGRSPPAFA